MLGHLVVQTPGCLRDWKGRLASVECLLAKDGSLGLVRVVSDDGVVGWGQLGNKDADISAELLMRRVMPAAIGQPLNNPWRLAQNVLAFELNYKCMGVQMSKAMSGLDSAVWDACGRWSGRPVAEIIALDEDSHKTSISAGFPVYASNLSRSLSGQALAEVILKAKANFGIRAFKVKVGKRMEGAVPDNGPGVDEWPGRTEEVLSTVRSALGDDDMIAVDANGGFQGPNLDFGRLEDLVSCLREQKIAFLEEPFPWTDQHSMQLFKKSFPDIVLAGGEQEFRMDMWEQVPSYDIFQPDVGYCGGPSMAALVARIAKKNGRRYIPHSPQGDLHVVFALHLACAFSDRDKDHLELACLDDGLRQILFSPDHSSPVPCGRHVPAFFEPKLVIENGHLFMGDKSQREGKVVGWGITIPESLIDDAYGDQRNWRRITQASGSRSYL